MVVAKVWLGGDESPSSAGAVDEAEDVFKGVVVE